MNKQQKLILIATAIGCIATFLPWISVSAGAFGYNINESRNGFHGSGVLYFLIMLATSVVTLAANQVASLQKNIRLTIVALGAFGLILLLIAYSNLQDQTGGGYGVMHSSIGIGLILSFLASAGLVAIPIVIKQPGESLQNDFAAFKTSVQNLQASIPKPTKTPVSNPDRMAELEKLIAWRNEGKISQTEFEDLKSKVM